MNRIIDVHISYRITNTIEQTKNTEILHVTKYDNNATIYDFFFFLPPKKKVI